jgi:hypothetical protein
MEEVMAAGAATARLVTLVTAKEKREFERKAKAMGFRSVGDLVRRSVRAYEGDPDAEELALMARLLRDSNEGALKALEDARCELRETRAYFQGKAEADR